MQTLQTLRDGASVNEAALNRIAFIFPNVLNVVCFSHTLDNVGNHLAILTLLQFGNLWIHLFSRSHQAKLAWQDLTGRRPQSYSETRWWSKWEVYQQLLEQLGDICEFLEKAKQKKICAQIVPQLLEIMSDPQRLIDLKLEPAVTVDVGQHFVKATYYLESDGSLVFSCYEKLKAVAEACQTSHFPNVRAFAVSIANQDATQNDELLERKAKECVQPAIATAVCRGRTRCGHFIRREDGRMVEASRRTTSFNDQQQYALADYLQASVMLQYNKR